MKDIKTILEFMEARDPFTEDSRLRSIVTSIITDNRVNFDKAKEVGGQNILKTMTHKNTDEYSFKKDKQGITMDTYIISEVIHKEIQVDPQLLCQCIMSTPINCTVSLMVNLYYSVSHLKEGAKFPQF